MATCLTCAFLERRDAGEAAAWDCILRTPTWDVVHAFGTAVEGWLVLVVRRHITALSELTDDEAAELGPLIRRVSQALEHVTGCEKTYVVQFAEKAEHRHVHVHVIPRAGDLPDELQGPRVFDLLGVDGDRAVTEERMTAVAERVAAQLRLAD